MDVSSYVLLSQEQALRRRLDIAANNMANMNTVGFRREGPVFREYVEQTPSAVEPAKTTSFVLDYGAVHDTTQGAFQHTGNPLDVMIDGPGYLAVEGPGGGTAYTRAGFISVRPTGELATSGGLLLRVVGGMPSTVSQEDAATLTVSEDGTVSGKSGPLGRIAVTVFESEGALSQGGNGLFTGSGGRELGAADTKLKVGGVESSNVNPITETTDMIEILRTYQTNQHIADSMADLRKRAIDSLGKFN